MSIYILDSNILLRLAEVPHPTHRVADDAIQKLLAQGHSCAVFPQNVREFWNTATRPSDKNGLGLTPAQTQAQIASLLGLYPVLEDGLPAYREWLMLVQAQNVSGVQVHDAYLAAAMRVHAITDLLTFNTTDFKRFGITAVDPATV